jgi:hypothetical protein
MHFPDVRCRFGDDVVSKLGREEVRWIPILGYSSEKVRGLFYTSIRCWKHPNYFSLGSGKQRIILFHKYFRQLHDVLLFCCYFVRRYFMLPYNVTFEVPFPVIL